MLYTLPFRKTLTALFFTCSLAMAAISTAQASDIEMSFQNLLQQERTWAGLQSKTLKVERMCCLGQIQIVKFFLQLYFTKFILKFLDKKLLTESQITNCQ